MNENTIDSIMAVLEQWSAEKRPINPTEWTDAAMKLNALQGNEDDKWFLLEQLVAKERVAYIEGGKTVAEAKARVEASETYLEARKQKAKIERVKETIRLAKHRSRLASEELRSQ